MNSSLDVDTIIPQGVLDSTAIRATFWANAGPFFTDTNSTMLYSFASTSDGMNGQLDLIAGFNSTSGVWTNISVVPGSISNIDYGTSANTESSGLGLSFSTGGFTDPSGVNIAPGMIRFDASAPDNPTWWNETNGVPNTRSAAMSYARFGSKGVLIGVGGLAPVISVLIYSSELLSLI